MGEFLWKFTPRSTWRSSRRGPRPVAAGRCWCLRTTPGWRRKGQRAAARLERLPAGDSSGGWRAALLTRVEQQAARPAQAGCWRSRPPAGARPPTQECGRSRQQLTGKADMMRAQAAEAFLQRPLAEARASRRGTSADGDQGSRRALARPCPGRPGGPCCSAGAGRPWQPGKILQAVPNTRGHT